MTKTRAKYPNPDLVDQMLTTAKAHDIQPAGFEVSRDGTIRIFDRKVLAEIKKDEFAKWEDGGALD